MLNNAMEFSSLPVGEYFFFAQKRLEICQPYQKIEEARRPYTPEAYSNAKALDGTVFYVAPTVKVVKELQ